MTLELIQQSRSFPLGKEIDQELAVTYDDDEGSLDVEMEKGMAEENEKDEAALELSCIPCPSMHKLFDFKLLMKLRQEALEEVYNVGRLGDFCTKYAWNPTELNCGKCTAIVRFKVSRPVNIESFGFYGPFEDGSRGKYHVDISLLTEDLIEIAGNTTLTPVIKSGDIFHVKFDSSVPILPCLWYIAKFSLLGPPTRQSRKVLSVARIKCGAFGETKFTFEMPDSNQLPEIGFSIRA